MKTDYSFKKFRSVGKESKRTGALFPSLQCHHSLAQTKGPNPLNLSVA